MYFFSGPRNVICNPSYDKLRRIYLLMSAPLTLALAWENQRFVYAKKKKNTQISLAVAAKLISAFVLATWIVQYLFFLNTKFQASRLSPLVVQPGLCQTWSESKLLVFSRQGSIIIRDPPMKHQIGANQKCSIILYIATATCSCLSIMETMNGMGTESIQSSAFNCKLSPVFGSEFVNCMSVFDCS